MSETVSEQKPEQTNVVSSVKVVDDTYIAEASIAPSGDVAHKEAQKEQKAEEPAVVEKKEEQKTEEVSDAKYGELPKELHKFQDSYQKNGKLTDADYLELQKIGIPKGVADEHVKMRQKLMELEAKEEAKQVESHDNEIVSMAGGKETFEQVRSWAVEKLSVEELTAFNNIMNGKDLASKKLAMSGLNARFLSDNPREPRLVSGSKPTSGASGYENNGDWLNDIRNPRYKKEASFRAEVDKRLAASKF